jgi:hypothetical protein
MQRLAGVLAVAQRVLGARDMKIRLDSLRYVSWKQAQSRG